MTGTWMKKVLLVTVVVMIAGLIVSCAGSSANVKDTGKVFTPSLVVTNDAGIWTYLWKMDNKGDIMNSFRNDGTGSAISLDTNQSFFGKASIKLGPPTKGLEAKIRAQMTPGQVVEWNKNSRVIINIYVPAKSNVNSAFIFIMQDRPFVWLDGLMNTQSIVAGQWNELVYELSDKMKNLPEDKIYVFGISCFSLNANGKDKTPMNSAVNLNGIAIGN